MNATPPTQAQPPAPHSKARLCQIHGIALGPLGRCVICQRAGSGEPDDRGGASKGLGVLLVLAGALGGLLVYRGLAGKPQAPVVVAEARPPPPSLVVAPVEEPQAVVDEERAVARVKAATEEQQRGFAAARRKVPVSVYTTKRCELCATARDWMKSKQYAFTEIDVEASPEGLTALRQVNPETTVPTFVIDGEVFVGFGPGVIQGAMFRATEKRAR